MALPHSPRQCFRRLAFATPAANSMDETSNGRQTDTTQTNDRVIGMASVCITCFEHSRESPHAALQPRGTPTQHKHKHKSQKFSKSRTSRSKTHDSLSYSTGNKSNFVYLRYHRSTVLLTTKKKQGLYIARPSQHQETNTHRRTAPKTNKKKPKPSALANETPALYYPKHRMQIFEQPAKPRKKRTSQLLLLLQQEQRKETREDEEKRL